MTSSSTDSRPSFFSADRAGWVRLAVVVAFAAAALIGPLVGSTSAQLTDSTQVGVTITVPPPDPPAAPTP